MASQLTVTRPTIGAVGLGAISQGTGSSLTDAAIGAGIGYLISPSDAERALYAAYGALAVGLGGVLGIGILVGVRYLSASSIRRRK
jgi:hypothetical protein